MTRQSRDAGPDSPLQLHALLTAIAVAELAAGVGLLFAPSMVAELLLGLPLGPGSPLVIGRVAGIALIALGLICWLERANSRTGALRGLLIGLLVYNGVVALLLIQSRMANDTDGIALWPAVVVHLAFAAWLAAIFIDRTRAE